MKTIVTHSADETKKFAALIAQGLLNNSRVVALIGDLGAGKTTFAQGFAKGLGIKDKIVSPTFILMRQHPIPNTKRVFYHIDLYRINHIKGLGLEEIMDNKENIVLIEWAERLKKLPKNALKVKIKKLSENSRQILIL